MGAAEFLAKNKEQLKGNIMLIFQPAEEGPPEDEGGGQIAGNTPAPRNNPLSVKILFP